MATALGGAGVALAGTIRAHGIGAGAHRRYARFAGRSAEVAGSDAVFHALHVPAFVGTLVALLGAPGAKIDTSVEFLGDGHLGSFPARRPDTC